MSIISCQFLKIIIYLNHFIFSILKVTVIWNFILVRYDLVWWGELQIDILINSHSEETQIAFTGGGGSVWILHWTGRRISS